MFTLTTASVPEGTPPLCFHTSAGINRCRAGLQSWSGSQGFYPTPALCGCPSVEREEQSSRARVRDFILRSRACVCVFIVSDPRTVVAVSYQGHNVSNVGTSCGTVSESSPRFLIHCLPSACPLSHWYFTVPVVYLVGWRPKPWTLLKVAFPGGSLSQGG